MNPRLQCQCGKLKGEVSHPERASRAICYCKDCQAFAHFLGRVPDILDANGGTEIIATSPQYLRFTQGLESLANMSLSDRGLLRWYARCCHTPIANTPRDFKTPYVGLIASCLSNSSPPHAPAAFGPIRAVIQTASAKGVVKATPVRSFMTILRLMRMVLGSRLNGTYRQTPFFTGDTGKPVVSPQVLTAAERHKFTP